MLLWLMFCYCLQRFRRHPIDGPKRGDHSQIPATQECRSVCAFLSMNILTNKLLP